MTTITIADRFLVRGGTAAALASVNEVLKARELCFETDTGRFKLGDGAIAWNALAYIGTMSFAVAAGTADALTADFTPDAVLTDGNQILVRAAAANTGAATLATDGGTARAITKLGGTALAAGDIAVAGHELLLRYRSSVPRWELLNPASAGSFDLPGTIHAATSKATPVDADELALADSAASYALKKLTWANVKAGIWAAWGALIAAGTGKTTPVNADSIAICDSAASNATKSLTFTNLKAFLKTYFDTLYSAGAGWILVGSSKVSGGAVTTITVSGLDLTTDIRYFVEIALKSTSGSAQNTSMFFNGDTTATNYYSQYRSTSNTTTTGALLNGPGLLSLDASGELDGYFQVWYDVSGLIRAHGELSRGVPSGLILHEYTLVKTAAANLTSLQITAGIASSLDNDSYIKIWKRA